MSGSKKPGRLTAQDGAYIYAGRFSDPSRRNLGAPARILWEKGIEVGLLSHVDWKEMNMHNRTLLAAATLAVVTAVSADNAHFIRASGTINDDGEYVGSWKEAGLGSNQNINYVLSAGTGTQFTYQCYTKSNNQPQGTPNSVFPSDLHTGGTFNSGKNGSISASLTLVPAPDSDCTGNGLKLCLDFVSYVNVEIKDETNGISNALPDLSRSFVVNNRPTNCEPF